MTKGVIDGLAKHEGHERPLSENELAWISFLRLITCDRDPPPNLERIQALRRAFQGAEQREATAEKVG